MTEQKNKVQLKSPQQVKFETTRGLLNSMQDQILKALPKHLPAESFTRAVLTLCQKNPKLLDCDKYSFLGAVMEAAQLGLVLGREAHLVPFRNNKRGIIEVQMISDYKGLIKLVENSGAVSSVRANVVRVGDTFETTHEGIIHIEKFDPGETKTAGDFEYIVPKKKGPIWGVYAEATRTDGRRQNVFLTMDDIERARASSKNPGGTWTDHFVEMTKKTAIRRLTKYIPQSPQLLRVTELEELNDQDRSQGLKSLVDSEYIPEYETSEATTVKNTTDEGAADNENAKRQDLNIKVLKQFDKLVQIGFKENEILPRMKIKALKDLDILPVESVSAILDVLVELELR